MKVLLLSISLEGGAGGATYRLLKGLQCIGVDTRVFVQTKSDSDESVITAPQTSLGKSINKLIPKLDKLPLLFYPKRENSSFYPQWFTNSILPTVTRLCPDVINLHWVCGGWISIETIPKLNNKPLVWTLHDQYAFTGGCPYSKDCNRYTKNCGSCPQLHSNKDWDLSRWVWKRKFKAWKGLNLTVVSPSLWLAECAKSSSLFKDFRIEVIPNGIDTEKYKSVDKHIARKALGLSGDNQIVLCGAWSNERRKGFHLLWQAIQSLNKSGWRNKIELVVFGFSRPGDFPDLGIKSHFLGKLSDPDSMVRVYTASDVYVAPSMEDNLPNTVMEALACGTPSVAFRIGGMPDFIEDRKNGYLAQPFQYEDLAQGIVWVLEDRERQKMLSRRAREKVKKEFTKELQARRYLSLFEEVAENNSRSANV